MPETIKIDGVTRYFRANAHPSNVKIEGKNVVVKGLGASEPVIYKDAVTGAPSAHLEGTSCIGIYTLDNEAA